MHRIREVINVLNDFRNKRESNRSRKEYVNLLKQDLCNYYSYNTFLINKVIDLFPLVEVNIFLYITVFGKFVQLISSRILQIFALRHSIESAFLLT